GISQRERPLQIVASTVSKLLHFEEERERRGRFLRILRLPGPFGEGAKKSDCSGLFAVATMCHTWSASSKRPESLLLARRSGIFFWSDANADLRALPTPKCPGPPETSVGRVTGTTTIPVPTARKTPTGMRRISYS